MKNNLINLNLYDVPFGTLATSAQKIHDGFADNAVEYPTSSPALPVFQSHITALKKCIVKWGTKGNRGSHGQYMALKNVAAVVRNDMRQLAAYAQNIRPNDADSWAKLGFAIKLPKSVPQSLQAVQNLRHFISRNVPEPGIKLRWKKPLDSGRRNVKCYIIYRNNTNVFPGGIGLSAPVGDLRAMVTDTVFIDMTPLKGANWYWVTPIGAAGLGVTSNPVMVMSLGAREEE